MSIFREVNFSGKTCAEQRLKKIRRAIPRHNERLSYYRNLVDSFEPIVVKELEEEIVRQVDSYVWDIKRGVGNKYHRRSIYSVKWAICGIKELLPGIEKMPKGERRSLLEDICLWWDTLKRAREAEHVVANAIVQVRKLKNVHRRKLKKDRFVKSCYELCP